MERLKIIRVFVDLYYDAPNRLNEIIDKTCYDIAVWEETDKCKRTDTDCYGDAMECARAVVSQEGIFNHNWGEIEGKNLIVIIDTVDDCDLGEWIADPYSQLAAYSQSVPASKRFITAFYKLNDYGTPLLNGLRDAA
jgi:hypothetical protein